MAGLGLTVWAAWPLLPQKTRKQNQAPMWSLPSPHQLTPEAICSEARFWIGESIPNRYEDWPTWCPVLLGVIYSTAIVDSAGESANVPCPSGRGRWSVKITESTLVCGCHSGWRRCIQALPLSSCVILGHVLNLSKPSFICSSENRVSNGTCVT